jgi:hypothetical protein
MVIMSLVICGGQLLNNKQITAGRIGIPRRRVMSESPTGRSSLHNHPNMQNIPIRTPEGLKIRDAFLSDIEGPEADVINERADDENRKFVHNARQIIAKCLIYPYRAYIKKHQSGAIVLRPHRYQLNNTDLSFIAMPLRDCVCWGFQSKEELEAFLAYRPFPDFLDIEIRRICMRDLAVLVVSK